MLLISSYLKKNVKKLKQKWEKKKVQPFSWLENIRTQKFSWAQTIQRCCHYLFKLPIFPRFSQRPYRKKKKEKVKRKTITFSFGRRRSSTPHSAILLKHKSSPIFKARKMKFRANSCSFQLQSNYV